MSATVIVLYEDVQGARFDLDYYMNTHMPLVGEKCLPFGLKAWRVIQSAGTLDGGPAAFRIAALLEFDTVDQFRRAAAAEGPAIFGDVPNFTDIKPVQMLADLVGAS
jgi:uncharacterized protein (TIGR02118 family)